MARRKKEETVAIKKPAIESIYKTDDKKALSAGVVIGIVTAILVLIIIVLAAISMKAGASGAASKASENYNVSILGIVNAKTVSLPLLSIVLGFVDGFNPCAMWILVFLILMLIEMKDRKKMWILGSVFLLTSALIYLIFMVSWLNIAMFLTGIKVVRVGIGVFAVVFGSVNIYRFIRMLKEDDGCDVTDGKKRSKIMASIQKIVTEKSFIISVLGIMALAAGVNLLELMCSLGIPVVFTQILALNDLNVVQYMIYIILYLLFFMIDDFIVFIIAMTTLKIKGISNKYTKFSHLVGGIFMVLLGVLMVFKPAWVMFNFGGETEVVYEVTYGDFIKDAKLEDVKFEDDKINVYLFYGEGCPHCSALYNYLNQLRNEKYGTYFNLYAFETWYNNENEKLMLEVADIVATKDDASGVPFLVIGDSISVGYSDYNQDKVKLMLETQYENRNKVIDAIKVYMNENNIDVSSNTTLTTTNVSTTTVKKNETTTTKKKN